MLAQDYQDSISKLFNQESVLNLPNTAITSASTEFPNSAPVSANLEEDCHKKTHVSSNNLVDHNSNDRFDNELIDIEVKSLSDSEEVCVDDFKGSVHASGCDLEIPGNGKFHPRACIEVCDTFYVEEPESDEETENWREGKRETTTSGYRLIESHNSMSHEKHNNHKTHSDCLQKAPLEVREVAAKTSPGAGEKCSEVLKWNSRSVPECERRNVEAFGGGLTEAVNAQSGLENIQSNFALSEFSSEQPNVNEGSYVHQNVSSEYGSSDSQDRISEQKSYSVHGGIDTEKTEGNIDSYNAGNSGASFRSDCDPIENYPRAATFDWCHGAERFPSYSLHSQTKEHKQQQQHLNISACDEKMNKIHITGSEHGRQSINQECENVVLENQSGKIEEYGKKSNYVQSETVMLSREPVISSNQVSEGSVQLSSLSLKDENDRGKSISDSQTSFPFSQEKHRAGKLSDGILEKNQESGRTMLNADAQGGSLQVQRFSMKNNQTGTFQQNTRNEEIQSKADSLEYTSTEYEGHTTVGCSNGAGGYRANDVRASQNIKSVVGRGGTSCDERTSVFLNSSQEEHRPSNSGSSPVGADGNNTGGGIPDSNRCNTCHCRSMENVEKDADDSAGTEGMAPSSTSSYYAIGASCSNVATHRYDDCHFIQHPGGGGGSLHNEKQEFKFKSNNSDSLHSAERQLNNSTASDKYLTATQNFNPHSDDGITKNSSSLERDKTNCYDTGSMNAPSLNETRNAPIASHLPPPVSCSSASVHSSSQNQKPITQSQLQHTFLQGQASDVNTMRRDSQNHASDTETESYMGDRALNRYNTSCVYADETPTKGSQGMAMSMERDYSQNQADTGAYGSRFSDNRIVALTQQSVSSDKSGSSLSAASSAAEADASGITAVKCDGKEHKKENGQKVQHKLATGATASSGTPYNGSNTTIFSHSSAAAVDYGDEKAGSLHERDLSVNGRKMKGDYDRKERFGSNQVPVPTNKTTKEAHVSILSKPDATLMNQLPNTAAVPLSSESTATAENSCNGNNTARPQFFSSKQQPSNPAAIYDGRNLAGHHNLSEVASQTSRYDTPQACDSGAARPGNNSTTAVVGRNGNNHTRDSCVSNVGNINEEYGNSANAIQSHTVVDCVGTSSISLSSSVCTANATTPCIPSNSISNSKSGNICNPSYPNTSTLSTLPSSNSSCYTYHNTAATVTNKSHHPTQTTHNITQPTFPPSVSSHSAHCYASPGSQTSTAKDNATRHPFPDTNDQSSCRNFQNTNNSSNHSIQSVPSSLSQKVVQPSSSLSNCALQSQNIHNNNHQCHDRSLSIGSPVENAHQSCNCTCNTHSYQQPPGIYQPGYESGKEYNIAAPQGSLIQRTQQECSNKYNSNSGSERVPPSLQPGDYSYDRNVNNSCASVNVNSRSGYYDTGIVPAPVEENLFNQSQKHDVGSNGSNHSVGCCQSSKASISVVPSSHYAASSNRSIYNPQSNYGNNSPAFMSCRGEKLNAKDASAKSKQHFYSTTNSQSAQPSGAAKSLGDLQSDSSALHQLQEPKKLSSAANNANNCRHSHSRSAMATEQQHSSYQTCCNPNNPNQNPALKHNCQPHHLHPTEGPEDLQTHDVMISHDVTRDDVMPETALTQSLNQTPVYYEAPTKTGNTGCSECCQQQYPANPMAPFPNNKASSFNSNPRSSNNPNSSVVSPPGKPVRETTSSNSSEAASARQRLAGSLSTASDPSISGGSSAGSSDNSPAKILPTFGRGSSKNTAGGTSCAVKEKKKKGSHGATSDAKGLASDDEADHEEEHKLLKADEKALNSVDKHIGELPKNCFQGKRLTAYGGRAPGPVNPDMLYQGIQYKCAYLGSTQLISTSRPNRTLRMQQAHEAVTRIKAPDGEFQPSVEVFLHISTDKLALVNIDNNESIIEHPLRTISYIADIANIIVIMARRIPAFNGESGVGGHPNGSASAGGGCRGTSSGGSDSPDLGSGSHSNNTDQQNYQDSSSQYMDDSDADGAYSLKPNKIVCHILECDKAQLIAQSIGQAFHLAYLDFLKENGIEDESSLELEYLDVLNSQELKGEDLMLFANKEASKDISIFKQKGELTGVVVIESGWGSVVPTFVIANLSPTGPAARSGLLNVGDQLLAIDGTSVVGLTLANVQAKLKSMKSELAVRLTIVQCPPTTTVLIKRPSLRYQLGFSVQNGTICSLMRGGIAERGGIRVGHRIIEINRQSVVAVPHDKIVEMLATSVGQLHMKTMPLPMFRLLTGQDTPSYL